MGGVCPADTARLWGMSAASGTGGCALGPPGWRRVSKQPNATLAPLHALEQKVPTLMATCSPHFKTGYAFDPLFY